MTVDGKVEETGSTRATVSRLVSEHIRDLIFEGRVRPGERLGSEAIAEELGVSRVPVREALRQLDGSGLVEVRERRGAVVATVGTASTDALVELLRVRRELEPWTAAEAARCHVDEDLRRLDDALAAGVAAAQAGDRVAAGRAHHAVLQAVASAAHNATLEATLTPLHNRSSIAFGLVSHDTLPEGWPSHRRVRDAIADRDAPAARREVKAHLDEVIVAVRRSAPPGPR